MTSSRRNWTTIGTTFILVAACTFGYFSYSCFSDESLRLTLRLGARIGFGIYVIIFITRPLRDLFKTKLTRDLLKYRRQLGLVFGTLMMTHFCLIMLRVGTNPEFSLSTGAIFGAVIYLMIFLMMVTSFDTPARAIGPKAWRILHKAGLYIVGYAFASTLLPGSREQLFEPEYIAFTILIAFAALIRLTAFFAKRK